MGNNDGSEDRLAKNEFAELIQHLSVQEILAIEYCIGTNWSRLFTRNNISTHIFFCNLCGLETSSFKNLLAHIDGKKHKIQMESVKQFYHPDYTYSKNYKKDCVENYIPMRNEDGTVNSTAKQIPVLTSNNKGKLQNILKNNTVKKKTPAMGNVQSSCKETSILIDMQNEITKSDTFSYKKQKEKNANEVNAYNEGYVKSLDFVAQKLDITSKYCKETCDSKSTSKDLKKVTKIFAEKRTSADNSIANVNLKKRKIVVNPAAALSLKVGSIEEWEQKNTESNKNARYQTDKVLIPTVHKTKSYKNSSSSATQMHFIDPPKFSVKSYSSKPCDNDVYGILGVEYVIKILKNRNDVSPRFECSLCELIFDGLAMQRHLEGYNHRLKFCEKHFPTAIRQYRQYMQNVPEHEVFKVMAPVLAKLAIAIEQHHGRNLPYECYERDFSLNRHEILAKAFSCRHASEQYGPTFTHVVGLKEIDEYVNNRQNYMPPSFSDNAIFDIKQGITSNKLNSRHQNYRMTDKELSLRQQHRHAGRESTLPTYKSYMSSALYEDVHSFSSYKQAGNINVAQYVDDKTYNLMVDDFLKGTLKGVSKNSTSSKNRKYSLSPAQNLSSGKRKSLSPLRQNDIWQAYRHMVDHEFYSLDERFKLYRKDPETHPSYNEEWQKFWKRRKDELVSAGLDYRKYNYQPEWVRYVKIRIEELYSQEVENVKINCRERLCLPLTNDKISDAKYHVQAQKKNLTNELKKTVCNTDQPIVSNSSTLLRSSNNIGPQVVSVLRLMTALEDSLGSLGPKIIELLSKAIQIEKTNPLHVNAIILNDENCSLIETAKEKFKGLVIAGFFEGKKNVLNQVINDAEALLQHAYQLKQQLKIQYSAKQSTSCLSVNLATANVSNALRNPQYENGGLNSIVTKEQSSSSYKTENLLTRGDKKELASKLAASLVAQGKTDFDPKQLQQLIAVYKLIEKKKHESVGSVQHKNGGSLQDSISSKKTLSDTLSDLLKPSSSLAYTNSDVLKISTDSHSVPKLSIEIIDDTQLSSVRSGVFGKVASSTSFSSDLQNYSDNSFSTSGSGRHQLEQQSHFGINHTNNVSANQQSRNIYDTYNQYQNNNGLPQNWGWYSNMEINQNYKVLGPNNNFNPNTNWQRF